MADINSFPIPTEVLDPANYPEFVGPKGDPGPEIELQTSATHVQWRVVGEDSWTDLIALSEITGPEGEATAEQGAKADAALPASGGTLTNYRETRHAVTTSGNVTIDLANGNVQRLILDANRQITLPADPGDVSASLVLIIECATYTPTWNSSPAIEWLTSDGVAPELVTTANLVNVLSFIWDDTDSRWLGFLAGKEQ